MQNFYANGGNIKIIFFLLFFAKFQCGLGACNLNQWTCDDGTCIKSWQQCDGNVNCADGSDEITENCIHLYEKCPEYAFRCSYGACITGSFRCNGIKDCADGSDELVCTKWRADRWRGSCAREDDVECLNSKECIRSYYLCDGEIHCMDGSDESLEICAGYSCNEVGFHCGYGGCVNGNAKCTGKKECRDGSDEAWALCNKTRPIFDKRMSPTPTPVTVTTGKTDPDPSNCQIPSNIQGLILKKHPQNITINPGTWINNFRIVHIECPKTGQKMSRVCLNGKLTLPTCQDSCDAKLISGLSTRYNCFINDQTLDQDSCTDKTDKIPINVTVDIFCRTGYKRRSGQLHQFLRCLPNGEFDGKRVPCELKCGSPVLPATPLTKSGIDEKPSTVPWHVAIFERENNSYTYICGGSVVSPNIVISAAHCFWNNKQQYKKPSENYQFIGGKYTRTYTLDVDDKPQIRHARTIHISDFETEHNIHDVAVIVLETPFIFNRNISAICMPKEEFAEKYVASNRTGFVTGYGQNDNLERVPMVTEEYNSCNKRMEITNDKFCLNNNGGATVCRGDSGGGYVEKVYEGFKLVGIISSTLWADNDCARNRYLAVTNAAYMPPELAVILKNAIYASEMKY